MGQDLRSFFDLWIAASLGDLGRVLHYPLPIVLGIALTALGWWGSQGGATKAHAR